VAVRGPRGDVDRRTHLSRLDQLSRWDMSGGPNTITKEH
jgi:hypothetical protein